MQLTVLGFPVRVRASFLLIAVVLGAGGGGDLSLVIAWVVVAGISILLHELGHAVTFRWFGVRSRIELNGFGGVTIPVSGPGLRPGQQVAVSAAGPLTGLAVGIGLLAALRLGGYHSEPGLLDDIVRDTLFANIVWSLVNLVPVYPLDGGQLLGGVLRIVTRGGGEVATQVISFVTVIAVGTVAVINGYTIAAALLFWFWLMGARSFAARRSRRQQPAAERVAPPSPEAVLRVALAQYAAAPSDVTGARLVAAYVLAGRLDDAVSLVEGPQSVHLGPLSRQVLDDALRDAGRTTAAADGEPVPSAPA